MRASGQDDVARAAWREHAKQLPIQDLIIVDETGTQINMTPLYAYAPRGERAVGKVPHNYGANLTLIASLSLEGMGEAMLLDGAADGAAFETYIEQILAPSLRPGQIVILGNLSIHLGPQIQQAIEARGCQVLFLPAYSPDFSLLGPNICASLRGGIGFPSQEGTDLPLFATSPSLVAHHVGLSCLLKDSHREQTGKDVYFVFLAIIVSAIFFGTGS